MGLIQKHDLVDTTSEKSSYQRNSTLLVLDNFDDYLNENKNTFDILLKELKY